MPLPDASLARADAERSAAAALTVEGLTVFRGPLPAVRDVSFSVGRGQALGVLGRNGAGKTTLLCGLIGILPVEGRILLQGDEIVHEPAWRRARGGMALVPQGHQLLGDLSVQDNLRVAELEAPSDGPEFDIHELFPAIRPLFKRKAGLLSGGEQQQVAIARALLRRPTVLLLDEPTEGLAPAIISEITHVLKLLVESGLTLVLAEQHHHIVATLCHQFLVLRSGEIAGYEDTTTEDAIDKHYRTL